MSSAGRAGLTVGAPCDVDLRREKAATGLAGVDYLRVNAIKVAPSVVEESLGRRRQSDDKPQRSMIRDPRCPVIGMIRGPGCRR